ncbi:MAG TPA: FAD-dependent oxidoreductase, partial [Verrucomicrobiae bacterium]|nr:FAD-dependent oxidoreductase [Verrucomicrobiae bacterium]
MKFLALCRQVLAVLLMFPGPARAESPASDVCVYGGTAGGVAAAVQAARQGKSVILIEPGRHLGGMTSGGLGQTDIGNKDAIGGISREFYRRLGRHYGKEEAWTFEPGVAERTLDEMAREAGVKIRFGEQLAKVKKRGAKITELTMDNGNVIHARMFIDATYEGDLLARAEVSFTVGREANTRYHETLNGIRAATPKHQF